MSNGVVRPFIDGDPVSSLGNEEYDVENPSTQVRLFSLPVGVEADVNRAVESARDAFYAGRWSDLPPSERKAVLLRFSALLADNATELDFLDAGEMGKPISEGLFNAMAASNFLRFCGEALDKIEGHTLPSDHRSFVSQRLIPRGVVGAIVPWNYPTYNAILKIGPALAAGNAVVLKPSELSSRSALLLARLAVQAGVPPGQFNVVLGLGRTTGRSLALHPEVDMISFTGSSSVGKQIVQFAGSSNMKAVLAECGGKCPQIVFDDGVDMEAAADAIARSILANQGQTCSAGSRVLVERSVQETLIEKISAKMKSVVMGPAEDRATTFGPVASRKQWERVNEYLSDAADDGARFITGGVVCLKEGHGYFVPPALVADVPATARIAQEEVFGPVLSVTAFENDSEAVRLANGTQFGLIAYVWTKDLRRAMTLSRQIRSSVVINADAPSGEGPGNAFSLEPDKESGIGVEGGTAGVRSYMRRQLLWLNY